MEHFSAKIKFDREFPLHSAFLYTVLLERDNDELKAIHLENKEKILQVTRQVITGLAGKNAIRGSIDANVLSFMIAEWRSDGGDRIVDNDIAFFLGQKPDHHIFRRHNIAFARWDQDVFELGF